MKEVLAIGINPSNREPNYKHYDSPSEPDITLRKSLSDIFGEGNFIMNDMMNAIHSNAEELLNNREYCIQCFQEHKPELIRVIDTEKPKLILLMFTGKDTQSILMDFINELKSEIENFPEIIHIWQPAYANRMNMVRDNWMKYAEHIKERIIKLFFKEKDKACS